MIPRSIPSRPGRFALVALGVVAVFLASFPASTAAEQVRVPTRGGIVELKAKQQRREGDVYYADGDVDIVYQNLRLRADHVEYNTSTGDALARGHVQFEVDTQHFEAQEARYNVRTGRGSFRRVRGSIRVERRPNPAVLLSQNPLSFQAREVERQDESTYKLRGAWVTICTPEKPLWKFYAPRATVKLLRTVRMEGASFRLLQVPVLYLPVATAPLGKRVRGSGFLIPHLGQSSRKGFVFGDSFYWAPVDWADLNLGGELLSRRGWSQIAELRARPWEDVRLETRYYGVSDRGLRGPGGLRVPEGGHETHTEFDALLPGGWHGAVEGNQLTSLVFRIAFAPTFAQAVNPEVRTNAFLTNNFRGFSLNFYIVNYKDFLSASPQTTVLLRSAPGVRFSSVDQAPWKRWPIYFGFDAWAEAARRSDPNVETGASVQRTELAPRVTVPLRWGPWLRLTSSFTLRTTRYGAQLQPGVCLPDPCFRPSVVGNSVRRTTDEVTLDVRPPALARVWEGEAKWKHAIEPEIIYRHVNGVNQFGRFIRFDENDTLTDTDELEYSVTQRLFRRTGNQDAEELVSWRLTQKYYFDPSFGGALVPGQRNVFQALDSLSPFAFADGRRRFSPLVSALRLTPRRSYDAQFRVEYDPARSKMVAFGTLANLHPYRELFLTLAHFATRADPVLQPKSNQIRAILGYGELNRRGLNASFAFSYDVRQGFFQNQVAQVSFNGSCCGIALEFRRLALGPLRSENQFRVALLIANVGTFGNLRRQEKIF
jgi:LPS-assembly protein